MSLYLLFCATLLVLSLALGKGDATTIATTTIDPSWDLYWQDEFDGDHLNTKEWTYETDSYNWYTKSQSQRYTENRTENVRVENGSLVIEVQTEFYDDRQFTSGRIKSIARWRYGRFEVRARMPSGHHLSPGIWMIGGDNLYGNWPACGEIDIVEMSGDKPHLFESALHYGNDNTVSNSGLKQFGQLDLSEDFHLYTVEWSSVGMQFLFDNQPYFNVNLDRMMWNGNGTNPYTKHEQPFDRPFFLVLNVAVGGSFFGPGPYVTPEQSRHWKKKTMEVDYIRLYQRW